jgi:trans-2-enoyl-CoA reductase
MWHAPLNPADINTMQGKYPSPITEDSIRTSRFASGMTVAGSEGWGRVTNVMGDTGGIKAGDVVTVGRSGLGTFRSSFWTPATTVLPLQQGYQLKKLLGSQAATISQLGGTALRMLRDFVTLQPGEVVLQNAGNSGVGFMASQLGSTLLNVSVVSVCRRGSRSKEQWEELVQHLMTEGKCTRVVAEEDLTSREAIQDFKDELKRNSVTGCLPLLALNAVGGNSASLLCQCLEKGGTMVTFGGMSKQPVTIPTSQLIFRDLRLRGYWHSRWMVENSLSARQQLVDELADAVVRRKILCPPVKEFSFSQVDAALTYDRYEHAIRRKVVFQCQEE